MIRKNPSKVLKDFGKWKGDGSMRKGRRVNIAKSPYVRYDERGGRSAGKTLKAHEDMLVNLSQEVAQLKNEVADLKADRLEMAYEIESLKRRTSDDEFAELGAEILRVIERRKRYERN